MPVILGATSKRNHVVFPRPPLPPLTPPHSLFPRSQLERDESGVFRAQPATGLVPPHCAQLVAFCFRPPSAGRFERPMPCLLNGSARHGVTFSLAGAGSAPALALVPSAHLQFKPTAAGAVSTRGVDLRNDSDVPVQFLVETAAAAGAGAGALLSVEPPEGVLRGREVATLVGQRWTE